MISHFPDKRNYIAPLAGLKVLLLCLIFIWHTDRMPPLPDLGLIGTTLFFMVSGFLTAYKHIGSMSCSWQTSLEVAWAKLRHFYPLHLLTFLLAAAISQDWIDFMGWQAYLCSALLNLALLQSWFSEIRFTFNGVSWFLSSLLFCYFCSPMLNGLLARAADKAWGLAGFWAGTFCLRLAITVLMYINPHFFYVDTYVNPLVRLLEFANGASLGAVFLVYGRNWQTYCASHPVPASFCQLLLTIGCIVGLGIFSGQNIHTLFIPLYGLLLLSLTESSGLLGKLLGHKILLWASVIELEFFMLHQMVIRYMRLILPGSSWKYYLLVFVCTVILSFMVYKLHKALHRKA